MSLEESNKMSNQTPSQGSPSDPRNEEDYDTWDYGTEPVPGDATWALDSIKEAAEKGWDDLMDKADQPSNFFAEDLWEMEKKKARQQEERNTRHSVDKGEEFIESGMTLITDVESDRYLRKPKTVSD
jgi:hypothetical protein